MSPTIEEISELLAFRNRFAEPLCGWHGGARDGSGALTFPFPEYTAVVRALVEVASKPCWFDREYLAQQPQALIQSEAAMAEATIDQIRAVLTYFVRGERFSSGHWEDMIMGGHIDRILLRLEVLSRA